MTIISLASEMDVHEDQKKLTNKAYDSGHIRTPSDLEES